MGLVAMSLKAFIICIGLLLLLAMIPYVVAQNDYPHHHQYPPQLYFKIEQSGSNVSLDFRPDYYHFPHHRNYYDPQYGTIEIGPNESLTLSLTGVTERIYNPDINIEISLASHTTPNIEEVFLYFQLRFDGDGDGNFEYTADFPERPYDFWGLRPSSFIGEPINMTNGTIELDIRRQDNSTLDLVILCSSYDSDIQVPFDFDTDRDGIGDYSDPDDDNDGHPDIRDWFPLDSSEWKDSDWDGIGDNEDKDDNGNGIPDDFEIPLAMGIILIPILIIAAFMKRMKKSKEKETDKEEEIKPLTTSKIGPKNW